VVDRLLASPHYGERMALPWLDAARYADSNGFQQDGDTYQYVWRDWVVRRLNATCPSTSSPSSKWRATVLPNATDEQKARNRLHRCHLRNGEGGAIPEEQRNVHPLRPRGRDRHHLARRALACSQCHDHKYDPYTQRTTTPLRLLPTTSPRLAPAGRRPISYRRPAMDDAYRRGQRRSSKNSKRRSPT